MCLRKNHKLYKVAKKDLYTYKSLNNNLSAPYRMHNEFVYELNKVYEIKKWGISQIFNKNINEGFHSMFKDYYHLMCYGKIVLCKIPKGSRYYLGKHGDVVSNKIEIVKIIPIKNIQNEVNKKYNNVYNKKDQHCFVTHKAQYMMEYIKTNYPNNNLL